MINVNFGKLYNYTLVIILMAISHDYIGPNLQIIFLYVPHVIFLKLPKCTEKTFRSKVRWLKNHTFTALTKTY